MISARRGNHRHGCLLVENSKQALLKGFENQPGLMLSPFPTVTAPSKGRTLSRLSLYRVPSILETGLGCALLSNLNCADKTNNNLKRKELQKELSCSHHGQVLQSAELRLIAPLAQFEEKEENDDDSCDDEGRHQGGQQGV